jgi:hypothetical protein
LLAVSARKAKNLQPLRTPESAVSGIVVSFSKKRPREKNVSSDDSFRSEIHTLIRGERQTRCPRNCATAMLTHERQEQLIASLHTKAVRFRKELS